MAEVGVSSRRDDRFLPAVGGLRAQVWWLYLALGAVLLVAYGTVPEAWRNPAYLAVGLLGVGGIVVGARLHRPPRARAWFVLAAGQLLWVVGDALGLLVDGDRPPNPSDALYLAGYVPLAGFLFLLTVGRRPRRDVEGLLDSATVSVALYLLCWVTLAHRTVLLYADDWSAAVVSGLYPVVDVVLVAMLAALWTVPGARTATLRLLALAIGLVVLADLAAAAFLLVDYAADTWVDPLWQLSYLAMGAAALHPSMVRMSTPAPPETTRFSRFRLVATVSAVLVAPAVLVAQDALGLQIDVVPIALASSTMMLVVVGRMYVAIRQISAANATRDQAQRELAYQAAHDALTGLPNRAQTLVLLRGALSRGQRAGTMTGLLFVDLDSFKAINDSYGHAAGDEVLKAAAQRMPEVVRGGDVVGRLGGDEFVVVLEPLVEERVAVAVAQRLIRAISAPVTLSTGQHARVGASIGVAISQDARTDAEALMNEADVAAYRAKRAGRGRVEVFDATLRRELAERAEAEERLRLALQENRLLLRFLPVHSLTTGTDVGYEAVVHWVSPDAIIEPAPELRGAAESSDLVFDIDAWALQRAARQAAEWAQVGLGDVRVAVRVAIRHLGRQRVIGDVRTAVRQAGIEPHQLVVQVSDLGLLDDPVVLTNLSRLRESGITVSLDDFGLGYTSVRRLGALPLGVAKLDASFIDAASADAPGLLPGIIADVQNTGMGIVVKGVRSPEQLELLHALGCGHAQGPLFGPALSPDEVTLRLVRQAAPTG